MIKIAIRLDDITEDMNWQKFLRFKGLLDFYGIKPLIGVVPENMDDKLKISGENAPEDFIAYITELQNSGWVIAMHGVNHIYTTGKSGIFPLNNFSEFAGLSYDEQYELLKYGMDILNSKGIFTDIFMAPGHSYDKNTLKVLKMLGFKKVTDGFGKTPYSYENMIFFPISFKRSQTLKENKGYSTFVYHVNNMNEKDFENLEKLLKNAGSNNGYEANYEIISFADLYNCEIENKGIISKNIEYLMAKFKHLIGKIM